MRARTAGWLSAPRRIASWYLACWRQAIARDLQFRTQTVLVAVGSLAEVGVALVPALVVAHVARDATGWDTAGAMVVVGLFTVVTALLDATLAPNLARFDAAVREGDLDLLLVRPIPAFVAATARWVRPAELTRVLPGVALVVAALTLGGRAVAPGAVLACAVLMLLGAGCWGVFWINASLLSFWWSSAAPVQDIVGGLRDAGQYPRVAFRGAASRVSSTVAPAALLGAVPASALLGEPLWAFWWVGALLVAGVAVTAVHWRVALRRYDSASS
ncbi:MAG: ABC-2 family transporter protein [Arachnia sp.]